MPTIPEALATALALHQAGRLNDAEAIYQQILRAEPRHVEAWNFLGGLEFQRGNYAAAVQYIGRSVELMPAYLDAHYNLALALHKQGNIDAAIARYRYFIASGAPVAAAHNNLGLLLIQKGHADEAITCYRRAIELDPSYVQAHYNLGLASCKRGAVEQAVAAWRRTLELAPGHAEAWNDLGNVLKQQRNFDEATDCYERSIALQPDYAAAHSNLGIVHRDQWNLDAAIGCFRRSLALQPAAAEVETNLGIALSDTGCYEEAAGCFRRALVLQPDLAEAHRGLSNLLLLTGDYDRGWPEYEWRWRTGRLSMPQFAHPRWKGEPLDGRTILLWAEQGLGDTLQFVRYAPVLKSLGAMVLFECPRALMKLVASCPGIDRLLEQRSLADGTPATQADIAFDYQLPLLSLPTVLKTRVETIPANIPYLSADAALVERWRAQLRPIEGFRIGINWHGRAGHGAFRQRNIPLACFTDIAELPGVRLISLHKGAGREELAAWQGRQPIVDLGDDVDETSGAFMDTAAIMQNLDLVITSDTSIPHLAGALGVKVWLILPLAADWRWLLNRSDSPWYPTMRIFRQRRPGDWPAVFAEIKAALGERLRHYPEILPPR
jgi:tetratricopeptide (TPR) repeat protein